MDCGSDGQQHARDFSTCVSDSHFGRGVLLPDLSVVAYDAPDLGGRICVRHTGVAVFPFAGEAVERTIFHYCAPAGCLDFSPTDQ